MEDFLTSLTAQLKRHEGFSPVLYKDSFGNDTFGYGHLATRPITLSAGAHILEDDISVACWELSTHKPFWRMLRPPASIVIANMCFNLGWPRFSTFVKMWAALEAEDYLQASIEMRESLWAVQTKSRAEELIAMMRELHTKI